MMSKDMKRFLKISLYSLAVLFSLALLGASYLHVKIGEDDLTGYIEVLGFLTGGWGGLLLVKNHWSNWPVGIANGIFFLLLFWQSAFFADSLLQIIYIVAGFIGWYWWMRGGPKKLSLPTVNVNNRQIAASAIFVVLATIVMNWVLIIKKDAAPLADAFTTALSLAAYYLQMRRVIENWYIWILADLVYVPLYAYKHLYLTAIIYVIFLAQCIWGVSYWKKSLNRGSGGVANVISGGKS